MMTQSPQTSTDETTTATPSADFIQAISEFLHTNPDDLLVELGYYTRAQDETVEAQEALLTPDA